MNSQMKDALTEFISGNSAAIEQAIENGNHDLGKDEPGIQDLVNYLSCPTPQPCHKDNQTQSMDDKTHINQVIFNSTNLEVTHLTHFNSTQLQVTTDSNQYNIGQMCGSSNETNYSAGTTLNLLSPNQQGHQQFHQQYNSYEQNSSLYPDPEKQGSRADSGFTDLQLGSSSTFDSSRCHENNESQSSSTVAGSEAQYFHNGQSVNFQCPTDAERQYHDTLETQFSNTDSNVGQFQSSMQHIESSFKDSSVLSSSYTMSQNSEVQYGTSQDNLGYGLMDVIQAPVGHLEAGVNQFKMQEKMNVDEPEVQFSQADSSSFSNQCHAALVDTIELHAQSYNPEGFNAQLSLENAQSSSVSSSEMSDGGFKQSLSNISECHSLVDSEEMSANIAQNSVAFDLNRSSYHQSSLASPYVNQDFQQNASVNMLSSPDSVTSDFQVQQSPCQVSSVNSDSTHYTSLQSESTGFPMSASSSSSQFSYSSNNPSPYQGSQYQDSPAQCNPSSNVPDNFQLPSTNPPTPVPGFSQTHQLHQNSFDSPLFQQPQVSQQSTLLDHNHFQQNLAIGSDNCQDTTVVHSPDQHSVGYQSNGASSMNVVSFSPSDNLNQQQHNYLTSSVHSSSSQSNDPSEFRGYISSEAHNFSADVTSVNQICSSQSLTDFEALNSSNQRQALADSSKTASDVTMGEFSSVGNLGSFSQLDLEAVVSSFTVKETTSTVAQNNSSMNTALDPPSYDGYAYSNMATVSNNCHQATNTAGDVNAQFNFNQQSQPIAGTDSYIPSLSMATFTTGSCDQRTGHQFGSSSFNLHSTPQVATENYPQPMQVQDSDFANKIPEPGTPYHYHTATTGESTSNNTETAMDLSSGLGEKCDSLSSGISFEEIHRSIVKAGDALSKDITDGHRDYDSSLALTSNTEVFSRISGMYSTPPSEMFQAEASPLAGGVVSCNTEASVVTSLADTAISSSYQGNLNNDEAAAYIPTNNTLSSSSLSNVNTDHNLMSGNLTMVSSVPSSHHLLQREVSTQPIVTVPNFLENPATSVSSSHISNQDHVSFMSPADGNITQGQLNTPFILNMMTGASASIRAAIEDQSKLAAMPNGSNTPSLHHVLNSGFSQVTSAPENSQLFGGCVENLSQSSGTSFLSSQSSTDLFDQTHRAVNNLQTSQVVPALSLNLTEPSVNTVSDSVTSSNIFLHLATSHSDSKTSVSQNLINGSVKLGTNLLQEFKTNTSEVTFEAVSSGNSAQVPASYSTNQPQIIVSLEDLQKLLAQQNLSSAPSVHQQTHAAVTSPQTLVLQKHASHSLRHFQPRLLIRSAHFPTSTHLIPPHQQIQQTRDRLQLIVHQTQTSDNVPKVMSSQRNLDHTVISTTQDNQPKFSNSFQLPVVSQQDQQHTQQKLLLQQTHTMEHQPQPKIQLHLKQTHVLQQQSANLFLQQFPQSSDQKLVMLHLLDPQPLALTPGQQNTDQKHCVQNEAEATQEAQNVVQIAQMQHELQLLQKQQEKEHQEEQQLNQLHHQQHLQSIEKPEKMDRPCSENLKKDYKHLHSLLTGETAGVSNHGANTQTKTLSSALNLSPSLQGQSITQLSNGFSGHSASVTSERASAQTMNIPFSFLPLNNFPSLQLSNSSVAQTNSPLTTLAFLKTFTTSTFSKSFDSKESHIETVNLNTQGNSVSSQSSVKTEDNLERNDLDAGRDSSLNKQSSILAQILTERKRCHTPLSVDLNSPDNSNSEAGSPLSSPITFEDGNTQLTLIERSADLQIKSDTMHSVNDNDDGENAIFDLNAFHKRPSADESHSVREKNENVPMKIAKPSIDADARSSTIPPMSPESTFDFGSAVSSASNFFFSFGNKEENNSEVFTFGSLGTGTATSDSLSCSSKPSAKAVAMRSAVPTQPVRPISRKQKEYSLKAYYPSRVENMELKILEQPEPQHRARYQTEGSRGAIKDASQQGFPVIKLTGYSRATKLQVFIGDEGGRVKPHGFYQACRVFGKNSTACVEQEIEGTTIIEIEMLPENDMTVKLDCIGILKLRNADVERRIGPKRARDKKRTNTRARLVMRCLVEKSDGNQHVLQVASDHIVCTQPVGQPEMSRMSLSESSVHGGDSLFIIGKNFRNKGTSVLFQKLDSKDESVVWQAEAEIEQEFFQPTHLICKIPPYKDKSIEVPQVVEIVVISAGKKSDPQHFIYKPVYPVAPLVKQEIPMETDTAISAKPLPFVSPEALHLNRMVQQTHAQCSTSSSMFQLPPGTISAMHAVTASSRLIRPAVLTNLKQADVAVMPSISVSPVSGSSMTLTTSGEALPTFLLEEKRDGHVQKLSSKASVKSLPKAAITDGTVVNCIVHSNSNTNAISPMSYAISDSHPQPSLTSSSGAGRSIHTDKTSSVTASFPSKPFFVVVDPSALQTSVGGDKIQQLLQQILEAQSKLW